MIARLGLLMLAAGVASAQSSPKLQLKNVKSETVTYLGKQCLQLTDTGTDNTQDGERLAVIEGTEFGDGTIDLDLTGDTLPTAAPTARGFTGIAFRLAPGGGYESFYLRPKNGRADEQEQRNHSTQYVSFPDFPWQRLRQETPGKYESYVDLAPGEWTHVKVEVHGVKARLYVNGSTEPVLIVNDLKHGNSHGAVAYWIGPGTVAHFANLRITR